jgi:ankyrin repeat protein
MSKPLKWTLITVAIVALIVAVVLVLINRGSQDTDIWTAASQGDVRAVEELIAAGADINAVLVTGITEDTPGYGGTPLHIAALSNQDEVVEVLLENGADIEAKAADSYGSTALHWAAVLGHGRIVELLVLAGADVNAKDTEGHTPVDAALIFHQDQIAGYLRQNGGNSTMTIWTAAWVGLVDIVEQRLNEGWDINGTEVPGSGASPLHIAVLTAQEELVELLLQRGADIDVRADDENGAPPLAWAAFFNNYDMVVLLVEAGADVNALDAHNSTPLDAVLSELAPGDQAIRDRIADYLRANGGETTD